MPAEGSPVPIGADRRPMTPAPYRVVARRQETRDVTTLSLAPVDEVPIVFRAGQFNMLTAFGVGEAAISVSSAPDDTAPLEHTVREVGAVTRSLCARQIGDVIGVRGPFGTDWGISDLVASDDARTVHPPASAGGADSEAHGDIVVIAGGIGLAPLRGAVHELMTHRPIHRRRVFVIVGARDPSQIVFRDDLDGWARNGATVSVTVDASTQGWTGHVGLVTSLLNDAPFESARATALLCGPEIMMRFTARALMDLGVDPERIWISLERNMQCGVAWCGHCQLGPFLLCRDGPVLPYAGVVADLLTQRAR